MWINSVNSPTGVTGYHFSIPLAGRSTIPYTASYQCKTVCLVSNRLVSLTKKRNWEELSRLPVLFISLCFYTFNSCSTDFTSHCVELIGSYRSSVNLSVLACLYICLPAVFPIVFVSNMASSFVCKSLPKFEYCRPEHMKGANIWITINRDKDRLRLLFGNVWNI